MLLIIETPAANMHVPYFTPFATTKLSESVLTLICLIVELIAEVPWFEQTAL